MFFIDATCAVCGTTSQHSELGSTNTMGPPDLDLRPAPMARWTLAQQIQRCPECGYCARDISVDSGSAREVARNEAYLALLKREDHPEVTRQYLCASLILSVDGDDAGAGRAALKGAWAADDIADWSPSETFDPEDESSLIALTQAAGREQAEQTSAAAAAAHCRRLAIGYFEADRKRGLTFAADEASADAMLADLNRRVGDLESARAYAVAGMERGVEGFAQEVFKYQLWLTDIGDTACHNVEEVAGDGGLGMMG
jgi:hypothetical protein